MQSIKSHISLILALSAILLSIFLFRTFESVLKQYKDIVVDNYSIVIVSTKELKKLNIPNSFLIPIDTTAYKMKLQEKFQNLDLSSVKLPYFYKLKINSLLSPKEIQQIKHSLLQKPYIKRVLTHASSQTKIYNLLILINIITKVFMIMIATLGFLVIVKQLEVWKLLHNERMYIMELFGAPFWFRGAALFKIALIDSIFAIIITGGAIYAVINSHLFKLIIKELNVTYHINYPKEIGMLFAIAFGISLISTIIVTASKK
ncbi:MAG: hypothetical protein GXO62_03630 [Epsilonproteobacteria bacterium]|nr:hypothetical protein [Campylobacterota bacterium]